jgi:hypothetical protein
MAESENWVAEFLSNSPIATKTVLLLLVFILTLPPYLFDNNMKLEPLPLHQWEQTKMTLHLYCQIVGKIRLKSMPRKNHWWNITLYINSKGITTGPMPYNDGCFEIQFNLLSHELEILTSNNETVCFSLHDGLSVAEFHQRIFNLLIELNVHVKIISRPYSLPDANPITTPFAKLTQYASYQKEYVEQFWKLLLWTQNVFQEFSGRFYGKTSPVQLFWHHLDLAVTRFSGKKVPLNEGMKLSDKDAYSHEVVSFGFWAGDENVPAPAFYSYTYPSPTGLEKTTLEPSTAKWIDNNGSPMALLMYDDLIGEADPSETLLRFLESAYASGATLAGWDVEELKVPPLHQL